MADHTPGPWTLEVRRDPPDGFEYVVHLDQASRDWASWGWGALHRIIVYGSGLGQNDLNPGTRADHAEAVANARLIAAAPDLLAAARLALAAIGGTRDDFGLKLELEKAYLALSAAIAKVDITKK